MATDPVTIHTRSAAGLQLALTALCIAVGSVALDTQFSAGDRDLTRMGHLMASGFLVAAGVLAVVAVVNLVSRVVVDEAGVTVTSPARLTSRNRRLTWDELTTIEFGRAPGAFGTTLVCSTEMGERIGTGVLKLRRRPNIFAFAEALDTFGHDDLAGERFRRYLESNGLYG